MYLFVNEREADSDFLIIFGNIALRLIILLQKWQNTIAMDGRGKMPLLLIW